MSLFDIVRSRRGEIEASLPTLHVPVPRVIWSEVRNTWFTAMQFNHMSEVVVTRLRVNDESKSSSFMTGSEALNMLTATAELGAVDTFIQIKSVLEEHLFVVYRNGEGDTVIELVL